MTQDTDWKNIVIIGASVAGVHTAHALEKVVPETHRIILINAHEFAYWPVGGLRASVKPGFEKEIFASLENFFEKDSRHVVLAGYHVKSVNVDHIELDRTTPAALGGSNTISVDVGLIATGSTYAVPMRPAGDSLDEAVEHLRTMQREIAEAQDVMIVGGGPVGVEFAGEVKQVHPNKNVTLVHQGSNLLPGYRLHNSLLSQLKSIGVKVLLETPVLLTEEQRRQSQRLVPEGKKLRIEVGEGAAMETDFLFIGTGGAPNTEIVPKVVLGTGTPARIQVDPATLRLQHEEYGKRWFSAGDVCSTPDSKTCISASAHGPIAAAQIVAQIESNPKRLKKYKVGPPIMAVPLGLHGGATQIVYPVFGQWVTSWIKGRTLFTDNRFATQYPGGRPLLTTDH